MDSNFHGLPPLKRFRILQQQQQQNDQSLDSFSLPSKKRKESRDFTFPHKTSITTAPYSLPTKKRVWAFQPCFSPDSLDLNVEYKPDFEENHKEKEKEVSPIIPSQEEDDDDDDEEEEEEDDGILCSICQSTDGDPSDPIVFCDRCDLMVHASCYGNPLVNSIPEGDWFCSQCIASFSSSSNEKKNVESVFSCCLCSINGGAMKPTNDGRWAHIVCGLFVPEVFFEDPDGREGIDCSKIPKRRWKSKCYICKSESGCCIDCSEPKCNLGFHVTCGLKEDLSIEYNQGRKSSAIVAGFCKNHTALWMKQQSTGKFKIVARDEGKL